MFEKMVECIKKKHIQDSYNAQIKPIDSGIPDNHIREHCLANLSQINMIGRDRCEQVRIERPTATGTVRALYTVIDVHDKEPDVVFVDKNPDDLWNRLEVSSADHFPGKVNAQVTAVGLTDAEAEASSEFIENLADNGYNHGLIVIAPHGGNIEKYTDEQAEHVGQKLSSEYVSEWICKGFKKGGVPLTVGTSLLQILAKNHSRSLILLCGVTLNIPLRSMDGTVIPFASEEAVRQTI
jgi:hypothetical protein